MTRRARNINARLLAFALLPPFAATGWAGDSTNQVNGSFAQISISPSSQLRMFPDYQSLLPVPVVDDLQARPLVECDIQVQNDRGPVRNARARFIQRIILEFNESGALEDLSIGDGKLKTDKDGHAEFDVELPVEILPGSVKAAWWSLRLKFTNKKRANEVHGQCIIAQ